MKISELIKALEEAKEEHGDLPLATWDGQILNVILGPTIEGCQAYAGDTPDEIALEIICNDH